MDALARRLAWLPGALNDLINKYDVPGAAVSVWHHGEEYPVAAGMANAGAGIEATPDTLFHIASITKVYTASLMLRLVERGAVSLDKPVLTYLPEFRLANDEAAAAITIRHLLTHMSGMTGDVYVDYGRGDDALERYVAGMGVVTMLHEPGAMYSYCNSGFNVAGRVIERVLGQTWESALESELLEPLGTTSLTTFAEVALRYRTAVSHVLDPVTGKQRPGALWPEIRSGAPCGNATYATASELIRFARLHLDGGVNQTGSAVLTNDTIAEMQAPAGTAVPSDTFDRVGQGLGWALYRYGDETVLGHDGGYSTARLRVIPGRDTAVAVLTNAKSDGLVGHHIIAGVVQDLLGLTVPTDPPPYQAPELDLSMYTGVYRRSNEKSFHVVPQGYRVVAVNNQLQIGVEGSREVMRLRPFDTTTFIPDDDAVEVTSRVAFLEPERTGQPRYLHIGDRAYVRGDSPAN